MCNVLLQKQRERKETIAQAVAIAKQLEPFKNSLGETHNNQRVVPPKNSSYQSFSKNNL